jgi:hypothetical protein
MLNSAGIANPTGDILRSDFLPEVDFSHGNVWEPGTYQIKTADGKTRTLFVNPSSQEIAGPWQVEFDTKWGGPARISFEKLEDWSTHDLEGIRYYSGVAVYRTTFKFAEPHDQSQSSRIYLDLGKVAIMAEVTLNGKNLGILWNAPFRVDATQAILSGDNVLAVKVVNVWTNRIIGDEQLPEDSDRDEYGEIKAWPQWILEGKTSPTGRFTFSSTRTWNNGDPLVQSGLLGPVRMIRSEKLWS